MSTPPSPTTWLLPGVNPTKVPTFDNKHKDVGEAPVPGTGGDSSRADLRPVVRSSRHETLRPTAAQFRCFALDSRLAVSCNLVIDAAVTRKSPPASVESQLHHPHVLSILRATAEAVNEWGVGGSGGGKCTATGLGEEGYRLFWSC